MSGRKKSFLFMLAILFIVMLVRDFFISGIIYSIFHAIFGEGVVCDWVSTVVTCFVSGALIVTPLYIRMRDDATERHEFLKHFENREYNAQNATEYIRSLRHVKINIMSFGIALFLVLLNEYLISALSESYVYFVVMAVNFFLIYAIYLVCEYLGRRRLYCIWEEERLHKKI